MKKGLVLGLLIAIFLFGIVAPHVAAQENNILEPIRNTFGFIFDMFNKDGQFTNKEVFYAKFLLWLILFSILLFASKFVFPNQGGIGGTIAAVIAIIALIPIPGKVIQNIFDVYGVVAVFILFGIPIVSLIYISHKIAPGDSPGHSFIRFLMYLALFFAFIMMKNSFDEMPIFGKNAEQIFNYMNLFLGVMGIMMLWSLVQAIRGMWSGGGSSEGSGVFGRGGSGYGREPVVPGFRWLGRRRRNRRERKEHEDLEAEVALGDAASRLTRRAEHDLKEMKELLLHIESLLKEYGKFVKGNKNFRMAIRQMFLAYQDANKIMETAKKEVLKSEVIERHVKRLDQFIENEEKKLSDATHQSSFRTEANKIKSEMNDVGRLEKAAENTIKAAEENLKSYAEMIKQGLILVDGGNGEKAAPFFQRAYQALVTAESNMKKEDHLLKEIEELERRIEAERSKFTTAP